MYGNYWYFVIPVEIDGTIHEVALYQYVICVASIILQYLLVYSPNIYDINVIIFKLSPLINNWYAIIDN